MVEFHSEVVAPLLPLEIADDTKLNNATRWTTTLHTCLLLFLIIIIILSNLRLTQLRKYDYFVKEIELKLICELMVATKKNMNGESISSIELLNLQLTPTNIKNKKDYLVKQYSDHILPKQFSEFSVYWAC